MRSLAAPPALSRHFAVAALLLALLAAAPPARAQLEARLGYTADVFADDRDGGPTATHDVNASAHLDLSALGWRGATAFVWARGDFGAGISDGIGVLQPISNIEGPDALRLYEAWLEQAWGEGRASIRAGLYDVNTEFYTTGPGALFVNTAHGVGPDFSQSGRTGPSIYPVTGLGARAQLRFGATAVRLGVVDGEPGSARRAGHPGLRLSRAEGALFLAEIAHRLADERFRLAVGGWHYSQEAARLEGAGTAPARGAWLVGDGRIGERGGIAFDGYVRAGAASPAVHALGGSWGGGLVASGFRSGRDQLGVALSRVYTTAAGRDAGLDGDAETVVELTYAWRPVPGLTLQPDVQYVAAPLARSGEHAWAVGLRLSAGLERSFGGR